MLARTSIEDLSRSQATATSPIDHESTHTPRPRASALKLHPVGDSALGIELGDTIDDAINARVLELDAAVMAIGYPILETVPTYRALLVHYDALAISYSEIAERIESLSAAREPEPQCSRIWEIPVVYGGTFGVDLGRVAAIQDLSEAELIRRHTAPRYRVHMIGFVPGFTYLGGLDPRLATPRLDTPRATTPAGSISIGGSQTAVASLEAPSGWHLLGRTPVRPFMANRDPVCILSPGDSVVFCPIPERDWHEHALAAQLGDLVARQIT